MLIKVAIRKQAFGMGWAFVYNSVLVVAAAAAAAATKNSHKRTAKSGLFRDEEGRMVLKVRRSRGQDSHKHFAKLRPVRE